MTAMPGGRRARLVRLCLVLALLAATIAGAVAMSFQCDDAYITFRYVSNAMDGHGLVWNPPPFLPVEGYTGFLWAMLLWGVWAVFGVEPPDAANVLSIGFGILQFVVVAIAAFRLRGRDGARVSDAVALTVIACVVGQRTFLQWMTSGLETALFNLALLAWVLLAMRPPERRDTRWLLSWSAVAAVAALTRPDGLLFVAATAVAGPLAYGVRPRGWRGPTVGLSPLLAVAAHVTWRRRYYGEWLPNTYHAKVVAPWPEAGIGYFKCFLFEHGAWLWFPVAALWAVQFVWVHRRGLVGALWARVPGLCALAALTLHVCYYVFRVGGDHFEYRVLSHLVPLLWLGLGAMFARLARRPWAVLAMLVLSFGASTLGWVHFVASRDMKVELISPLADKVPAVLRPLFRWHDMHQALLHMHFVCMRVQQHRLTIDGLIARYPPRGRFATGDDIPVRIEESVGLAGWVLRDCAVIDSYGLNDWVVARTPAIDWSTEPTAVHFGKVMHGSDVNGDGWWDRDEMRRYFLAFFPQHLDPSTADPLVDLAFALFAGHRADALTRSETDDLLAHLFSHGLMAHERLPPKGYVEAFEPNVAVSAQGVTITPRAVPLRPRIQAIEAEWRERIRTGRFERAR